MHFLGRLVSLDEMVPVDMYMLTAFLGISFEVIFTSVNTNPSTFIYFLILEVCRIFVSMH